MKTQTNTVPFETNLAYLAAQCDYMTLLAGLQIEFYKDFVVRDESEDEERKRESEKGS